MSYREENDQVILTMSREDFDNLLIMLGAGTAAMQNGGANLDSMLAFLNRLNSGNPNYTPYQVGEKKS